MKQITTPAILSTAYFPNIQYITKFMLHKTIIFDYSETFLKQSYRNRCKIYGANGILNISIPIIKPNGNRTQTKDIIIEYKTNWMQVHWRALISAYNNSPFFEIFEPELAHLFEKQEKYLVDFNIKVIQQIFKSLGRNLHFEVAKDFINKNESPFDFRDSIHPKERMWKKDQNFHDHVYNQVFGNKFGFHPNLSFIDLLFNEGPQAIDICLKSISSE